MMNIKKKYMYTARIEIDLNENGRIRAGSGRRSHLNRTTIS